MINNRLNEHPASVDWTKVRSQFELDPDYIHLSLSLLTPHPASVRAAIETHRRGLDTNPGMYYTMKEDFQQKVLKTAARFLNTHPDSIALTESTTMGLGMIYSGLLLNPGDEILVSEHDHYSALEAIRFRKLRMKDLFVKKITLYRQSQTTSSDEIIHSILSNISPQTRVVALTWVHSGTGVKLPISKITDEIKRLNQKRDDHHQILTVVDGVHGFGVEDFEIESLGCDFFVTSSHKWLFGPRGTGFIWGSPLGWRSITPIIPSFDGDAFYPWVRGEPHFQCPQARLCNPGGFQAFEHRWALTEAFDFQTSIGKKSIQDRIQSLNEYCKNEMLKIPNVQIRTPVSSHLSAGFICFDVDGMSAQEVVSYFLQNRILISQTPYVKTHSRFVLGILNSFDEIDETLETLKKLSKLRN